MSLSAVQLDRRRFMQRAAIAAAIAAAGVAPRIARAQTTENVTLALDWYPNANHAGLYVAEANGAFAAAGLEVDVYTPSDPTVVLQTVGAGQDTFGISYQTDLLLARAQGVPVVSIAALVQHPLICVMALEAKQISRPADLVGKTVAYPGIPSQEAYLATMLETDGHSLDDINLVNVEFNLLPAVISGQADAAMGAYWTHETILAEREGHPVTEMRVEEWGVPDFYELVLVASEQTVAERPEVVRAFLSAVQQGYDAAIADPAAAIETLTSAYPETDREVEEQGIELLIPVWTDGVPAFGTQTAERWSSYADWMKSRGLIPAELDADAAFAGNLLPIPGATPIAGEPSS
ncbi:MAG: ABC transporter substrate-binding protein [Thermomicrobiales bacterium]|nr:ABC transporter substrate-binding protein [Thermomicrobiales bacterium]